MDSGLLAGADSDGLAALDIAHGVGLGVLEGDQRDRHVVAGRLGQLFVLSHDVGKQSVVDDQLISALLESDAEDLLFLKCGGLIIRIDLEHAVIAFFLLLENLKCLRLIIGSDDSVGDFPGNQFRGAHVAGIREGDEIAEGGHSVRASCARVSTAHRGQLAHIVYPVDLLLDIGQRKADRRACGGDVLEGSRRDLAGCFLKFAYQLPAVEGVQKVDVSGSSAEDLERKVRAVFHKNAGRLLIGVAAVFEFHFFHFCLVLLTH